MYDPFTGNYAITSNWAKHLLRLSPGGIDYGMAVGTPLPAVMPGRVKFTKNNGTAGHTATLSNGSIQIQYFHLSRFYGDSGREVNEGDIIGYSGGAKGAPGAGNSTGPHLHIHAVVDGKRVDFRKLIKTADKVIKKGRKKMVIVVVKDGKKETGYTFDGYTFVPTIKGQGGMLQRMFGKPIRISKATFNAITIVGSKHANNLRNIITAGIR